MIVKKCGNSGFTLVEVVAVSVIVVVLAAYAIPRMIAPGEFAARSAADRFLAAIHYAQILSQRQGVETHVEISVISPHLKVTQWDIGSSSWKSVVLQGEPYELVLHEAVSIVKPSADNIEFSWDGFSKKGVGQYSVFEDNVLRYSIILEPTGFAHFR